MNDQNGDKTAAGENEASAETKPVKAPETKATMAPADEAPRELDEPEDEFEAADHEDDLEDSELEADPEPPEEFDAHASANAPEQPPEKTKRRGGGVKVVAYLIALALMGGGGYYLWNAYFAAPEAVETDVVPAESPAPEQKAEAERPVPAPETSAAPTAAAESAASGNKPTSVESLPVAAPRTAVAPAAAPEATMTAEAEKPAPAAPVAATPARESAAPENKPAEEPATEAPTETAAPAAAPSEPKPLAETASENKPAAESTPAKATEAPAAPEPAKPAEVATPAPAPAPAEPAKPVAAPVATGPASAPAAISRQTSEALAAMTTKLAAADATIEALSQRLQTVESELDALKSEARAAPPPPPPDHSGEAAARLAVAQSLLNAMRQGDDYSAQIAALQKLGAGAEQLARLRAGLSAPDLGDLEKEFAAMAPKLVQSAAPVERTDVAKPPQSLKDAIWAQVEMAARRLVRIRATGSVEQDAAASIVATIAKDLRAGDLAAALAERQQLPPPAQSLSDQWAAGVQTRIDAESAAKAALNAALQNLTRKKT